MPRDDLIDFISSSGHCTTPLDVSLALNISVAEAEEELCGLAGRCGGTLSMVKTGKNEEVTAKFVFPPDFGAIAASSRRRSDCLEACEKLWRSIISVCRGLFGVFILISLAIIVVVLVIVGLQSNRSRNGRGGRGGFGGASLSRQLHNLRDLAFLYYMLGGNNPFFRSLSRGLRWAQALCNPRLLLSPRRWLLRGARGDGGGRRSWAVPLFGPAAAAAAPPQRQEEEGPLLPRALAALDHFLFGPPPPGAGGRGRAAAAEGRRRARARARALRARGLRCPAAALLPFVDRPPRTARDISEAMKLVLFFRGVPVAGQEGVYSFPCLGDIDIGDDYEEEEEDLQGFFFKEDRPAYELLPQERNGSGGCGGNLGSGGSGSSGDTPGGGSRDRAGPLPAPPAYLKERRAVLTRLTRTEFLLCCALGLGNLLGAACLGKLAAGAGAAAGGAGSQTAAAGAAALRGYAWAFWAAPALRAAAAAAGNAAARRREGRRRALAGELLALEERARGRG